MYMHTPRGRDNAYVKRVTMSLLGSMSAGVIVLLSSPLTHCLFGVTVPRLGTSFALGPPKTSFCSYTLCSFEPEPAASRRVVSP
jgi:hypothetical protein